MARVNRVYIEKFDSIGAFVNAINTRHTNNVFLGHESSVEGSKHFTGTDSIEEANKLLLYGYKDPVNKMQKMLNDYNLEYEEVEVIRCNDVAGFMPDVPLFLVGIPEDMINEYEVIVNKPMVEVTVDVSVSAKITTSQMIIAGTKILACVNKLMLQGISVKLNIIPLLSEHNNVVVGAKVCVKDYDEEINICKTAYLLAHPSFLRRHGLKYLETVNNDDGKVSRDIRYSYGSPAINVLSDTAYKNIIPNGKLISTAKIISNNLSVEDIFNEINN